MKSNNPIVANAINYVMKNAAYNPDVAYRAWNDMVIPQMDKLWKDIKRVIVVLEHNKNEDMEYAQQKDVERLLKKAITCRGLIEKMISA